MKIQEVIDYLKTLVPSTYLAYTYPKDESYNAVTVITPLPGLPQDTELGITYPVFQVKVRGDVSDYAEAESRAFEIFDALANKYHVRIGAHHVVQITMGSSQPYFIGKDENERPIFTFNFQMKVK